MILSITYWIAPVSLSPAPTTYSAATVSVPSLEKPTNASETGTTWVTINTVSPPRKTTSAEMRVLISRIKHSKMTAITVHPARVINDIDGLVFSDRDKKKKYYKFSNSLIYFISRKWQNK